MPRRVAIRMRNGQLFLKYTKLVTDFLPMEVVLLQHESIDV